MKNGITFEEQELMALYNASGTRQGLIASLEEMYPYLGPEDAELKANTESCLKKLKAMSDAEYQDLELDSVLDPDFE